VQKSLEHFGMRVTVVERGIVWDAQVPKSKAGRQSPECEGHLVLVHVIFGFGCVYTKVINKTPFLLVITATLNYRA
jgi:hypothetical protein